MRSLAYQTLLEHQERPPSTSSTSSFKTRECAVQPISAVWHVKLRSRELRPVYLSFDRCTAPPRRVFRPSPAGQPMACHIVCRLTPWGCASSFSGGSDALGASFPDAMSPRRSFSI